MSEEKNFMCSGKITVTFSPDDTFQELFDRMIADTNSDSDDDDTDSKENCSETQNNLKLNDNSSNAVIVNAQTSPPQKNLPSNDWGQMLNLHHVSHDEDTFAEIGSRKFDSSAGLSKCKNLSDLIKSTDDSSIAENANYKKSLSSSTLDVIEMEQVTPKTNDVGPKKKAKCPPKRPLSPHARKCSQSSHWLNRS